MMFPPTRLLRISPLTRLSRRCISTTTTREPLRILFCGSDNFSIGSLRGLNALREADRGIVESIDVVHRPRKRVGRGKKNWSAVPIQGVAGELGLRTHVIDTFTGWTPPTEAGINLIIAVSFGLFIPPRILSHAKFGGLNVHPSLLPDLRGAAPIHHALLHQRPFTGITIQTLDPHQFDHGTRLLQSGAIPIPNPQSCSAQELLEHLTPKASAYLLKCLFERLYEPPHGDRGWYANADAQSAADEEQLPVDLAPKITKGVMKVDWETQTAGEIVRRHRILGSLWDDRLHPERKRVVLRGVSIVEDRGVVEAVAKSGVGCLHVADDTKARNGQPGRDEVYVKTRDGTVLKLDSWVVDGDQPNRPFWKNG